MSMADAAMGMALATAMLAHNVPLGLSLGLSASARSRRRDRACALVAGVLPPAAAMLTFWLLRAHISASAMRLLMCGAGGALLCLAVTELLPQARRQGGVPLAAAGFCGGLALLLVIMLCLRGGFA